MLPAVIELGGQIGHGGNGLKIPIDVFLDLRQPLGCFEAAVGVGGAVAGQTAQDQRQISLCDHGSVVGFGRDALLQIGDEC